MQKRVSRHIPQRRPRSDCAADFTHVQDDVNPHNMRMLEGSFFALHGPYNENTRI